MKRVGRNEEEEIYKRNLVCCGIVPDDMCPARECKEK